MSLSLARIKAAKPWRVRGAEVLEGEAWLRKASSHVVGLAAEALAKGAAAAVRAPDFGEEAEGVTWSAEPRQRRSFLSCLGDARFGGVAERAPAGCPCGPMARFISSSRSARSAGS
jgi:hypothetical protein